MPDKNCLPEIKTLYDDFNGGETNNPHYKKVIHSILKEILPSHLRVSTENEPDLLEDQKEAFLSALPFFMSTPCVKAPANLSCFVVSKFRPNAFKFFFDMISHWLIPGKTLNVLQVYSVDFRIPEYGQDVYTLCEVTLYVVNENELVEIQRNLPIIETEVRLGIQQRYYAQRILEIKGLSSDGKTAMIQENITSLITRLPSAFDYDLLTEMQYMLVMCRDDFKAIRECRHLSRIISVHYLYRKRLREALKLAPEKRHLYLKIFRTILHTPYREKHILSILIGINFLKDKEIFEEKHILSAIQNYIPCAQAVENSFFSNRRGNESICTLYLEIEKANGEQFTHEEIHLLRRALTADLRDRIEHLMHPVFMPRNEEEIIRNIWILSNEIKFLHDLPQLIVSFDKQTYSDLYFTVILVAIVKPGRISIEELFKKNKSPLGYIPDRAKTIGFLRKKYVKEATVFGVKLKKDQFLRSNHSIDLNKARQSVVNELTRIIGEVRDFNGGMITKQNELLCAIREQLGTSVKYNELMLENFFYSLSPDVMRTVLEPQILKTLFLLLLESIEEGFFNGESYSVKIRFDSHAVYAIIKAEDRSLKETLNKALRPFDTFASKLASSMVLAYDMPYLGYLYLCNEPDKQQAFFHMIQETLLDWAKKKRTHSRIQVKAV